MMLDRTLRALDRLSTLLAALAAVSLVAMTLLMLAEVVARNLLHQSLTYSWEFSGYLMGLVFFFGAAYTLRTNGHVRVTMLAEALPPRFARLLDIFATLVGLLVTGFIFYALADLTLTSFQRGVKSFTPTQTPLIIPQGLLALGALLLFLQMVARLIRLWRGQAPDQVAEDAVLGSDR